MEDAIAYETEAYLKLVTKLEQLFTKPPELKTYSIEEAPVHAGHL